MTRDQYGISTVVSQTSVLGDISGGTAKCWLFFFSRLLKSPGNFSGKKNCFMRALFEFKTKVSTILTTIQ